MSAVDLAELAIARRLDAWLTTHVDGFAGPFSIAKFEGGQSNPTYRISAASGDYVLRRKPFGVLLPSAHAIDREYRLLSALAPRGVPVPTPLAICADADVIGSMFYVMAMVVGRNHWNGALPDHAPYERRDIYHALVDTLAALHRVDVDAAGLSDYGKPGNFFSRQVARWTRQYRDAQMGDIDAMDRLIAWLPETAPLQAGTTIVHGDYRIDNLIFAAQGAKVLAILDWELSTLGDPLADLTYFAVNWALPADGGAGLAGLDLDALGIPALDDIVARYCAATGRAGVPDLNWYLAYNLFRMAAIAQGIGRRVVDGAASNARAAETAAKAPLYADLAWQFACRAGADSHSLDKRKAMP